MNIAVITAMPEETKAILAATESRENLLLGSWPACRCRAAGHELILVESGMGFDNAAAATLALLRDRRPDLLISAGYGGGLAAELQVGDVVMATGVCTVAAGALQEVPVEITAACRTFQAGRSGQEGRIFSGLFASTKTIMTKKQLALLLPPGAGYAVVEMESAAVAGVAAGSGIPFAGIRSVSDPLDEELGFSLEEFCDSRMRIRPHMVLLTMLAKPWIIPQIIRLARNSTLAAKTLSQAFRQFLETI